MMYSIRLVVVMCGMVQIGFNVVEDYWDIFLCFFVMLGIDQCGVVWVFVCDVIWGVGVIVVQFMVSGVMVDY